jgi:membrane protein implicated in regulation of membrane protease activity
MYRNGGLAASITYAKGALLFLPAFACYALLTIWLLPHLGMPKALVLGLPIYTVPIIMMKKIRPKILKAKASSKQPRELQ